MVPVVLVTSSCTASTGASGILKLLPALATSGTTYKLASSLALLARSTTGSSDEWPWIMVQTVTTVQQISTLYLLYLQSAALRNDPESAPGSTR